MLDRVSSRLPLALTILCASAMSTDQVRADPFDATITEHRIRNAYSGPIPLACNNPFQLHDCSARDRWFAGQFLFLDGTKRALQQQQYLSGTDLGISVRNPWFGNTVFYLGDTVGGSAGASKIECGLPKSNPEAVKTFCNDAILTSFDQVDPNASYDTNPSDGIDTAIVFDGIPTNPQFRPLLVPGVNKADYGVLPVCTGAAPTGPCLGPFTVPTGATAVPEISWLRGPNGFPIVRYLARTYLWYGAAIDTTAASSWLACSYDGLDFTPCTSAGPNRFSTSHFIQVSAELLAGSEIDDICASTPNSILCELPRNADNTHQEQMLLFGNGKPYRASAVYLAAMDPTTLAVKYYRGGATGTRWTRAALAGTSDAQSAETSARPIIADASYGEFSVKLIRGEGANESFLVMLSSQNDNVKYQWARLSSPEAWSAPFATDGDGYGPYVIDGYTSTANSELKLYHTLSSWNGPRLPEPYGVFTRPLRRANGKPFAWPPQ